MKELYKESKKDGNKDNEQRQISKKEKWKDMKENRKNARLRKKFILKTAKLSAKGEGGYIFGPKFRFKARVTGVMAQNKLKDNTLRTSLHSGTDHPLSFMYNEMQRQNKIQWTRRHRGHRPVKRGFFGPRYKVHTRIGKVHHMNVGNKYFEGIDDLNDGDLV